MHFTDFLTFGSVSTISMINALPLITALIPFLGLVVAIAQARKTTNSQGATSITFKNARVAQINRSQTDPGRGIFWKNHLPLQKPPACTGGFGLPNQIRPFFLPELRPAFVSPG